MESMLREALRKHNGLRQQLDNMLLGEEGDVVEAELKKFVTMRPCWTRKKENSFLRDLFVEETISIGKTFGNETLTNDGKPFARVDSDFKNWGLIHDYHATKEVKVKVAELVKNGTFKEIFGAFGENLNRLSFTVPQVKKFVEENANKLLDNGCGNFFLVKDGGKFFVANVNRYDDGWSVFVRGFSDGSVWGAEHRYRFMSPQLKP